MALTKITTELMEGKGVTNLPDVPGLTTQEMQEKFDELARDVIAPVINANVDELLLETASQEIGATPPQGITPQPLPLAGQPTKLAAVLQGIVNFCKEFVESFAYSKEQTDRCINEKVVEIGTGDMAQAVYDPNGNGVVSKAAHADLALFADNGMDSYTHIREDGVHYLDAGTGENIKFKATADFIRGDVFKVNGSDAVAALQNGEELDRDYFKSGNWVTAIFDGTQLNFKQGGAALNYKVIGSTTQPTSPKENTIWINTDVEIKKFRILTQAPPELIEGEAVMFYLNQKTQSTFFVVKDVIEVTPLVIYQVINGALVLKSAMIYTNNAWEALGVYLYRLGNEYEALTGGWVNGVNGFNIVRNTDYLRLNYDVTAIRGSFPWSTVKTLKSINLTPYRTLTIKCPYIFLTAVRLNNNPSSELNDVGFSIKSLAGARLARVELLTNTTMQSKTLSNASFTIDVTNINQECNVEFHSICQSFLDYNNFRIRQIIDISEISLT